MFVHGFLLTEAILYILVAIFNVHELVYNRILIKHLLHEISKLNAVIRNR